MNSKGVRVRWPQARLGTGWPRAPKACVSLNSWLRRAKRESCDPGENRIYQLWLIDDDGPRSAGTFRPEDGQTTVVLEGTAEAGLVVGLTVEPGEGSPQPTGEVLVAQPLT